MDTSHELAAFGLSELRPDQIIKATKRIIESGLTTVILGLLHIGRPMKEFPKMQGVDPVLQPIMLLDLPVKVRSWELTVTHVVI